MLGHCGLGKKVCRQNKKDDILAIRLFVSFLLKQITQGTISSVNSYIGQLLNGCGRFAVQAGSRFKSVRFTSHETACSQEDKSEREREREELPEEGGQCHGLTSTCSRNRLNFAINASKKTQLASSIGYSARQKKQFSFPKYRFI